MGDSQDVERSCFVARIDDMDARHTDSAIIAVMRRVLLGILLLGLVGTGVELLLLKHFEDNWQIAPLALIGTALIVIAWHAVSPGQASLRTFQATMLLFTVSGAVGVLQHFRGNVEWELERSPGAAGVELFRLAVMGATPTLAPGTMLQLGLIGLLYAFRHPILARGAEPSSSEKRS